ncbi:MAG: hypothetical protein KKB21_03155 [Nanoarchaeota archaeon]|nr:hypothetical protein [Nanoarchaeota archaeon]
MKKSRCLVGGLAGLVLAVAGCLCNPDIQRIVLNEKSALVVNVRERNTKKLYDSALENINKYFRGDGNQGYVDFMTPYSSELRDNIKVQGKEEVIQNYVKVHTKCLDLAVSRIGKKISNEDISDLAERLVIHMRNNAKIVEEKQGKSVIDYQHPDVKQGYEAFGGNRVEFFQRVIERNLNNPSADFNEAVRIAYTRKEFKNECGEYAEARKKMYSGFAKSTENFRSPIPFWAAIVRAFASIKAEQVRKASDVFNKRIEEEVYK